jgi:hypothetical protein
VRSTNLNAESKWSVVVVLGLLTIAGCGGPAGPKTYPVKGQVQLAGGEVQVLAGHNVEAALETESTVRAYGLIKDDGSFELETLRAGVLQSGAAEGKYRVRVALSDDDPEARNRATQAVNPRFLAFDSSGLSFQVPTDAPVTLQLSRQ